METELISLSNQTPFDDRPNHKATLDDLSFYFNKRLSGESKSRLASRLSDYTLKEILDRMDLLSGTAEHWYIKNLALMMFCDTPEKFFLIHKLILLFFQREKL